MRPCARGFRRKRSPREKARDRHREFAVVQKRCRNRLEIRPDGRLPLPFSRAYLERLLVDDVTRILEELEGYMS